MRFEIRFPYSAAAVAAVKTLPHKDRSWNPDRKVWEIDFSQLHKLASLISNLLPKLSKELLEGPRYAHVREELEAREERKQQTFEMSRAVAIDGEFPAPDGLSYLPYQKAGIQFCLSKDAVLIGDEMGLGKSIETIGLINSDGSIRKVLIVCPASLRINWMREIVKWCTRDVTVFVHGVTAIPSSVRVDGTEPVTIHVINYDILKGNSNLIHSCTWDLLVVDEAQYLRNPKTLRTLCVVGGVRKEKNEKGAYTGVVEKFEPIRASKKVFLTGTPIVNRPIELWPMLKYLDDSIFPDWKEYVTEYCAGKKTKWGWDVKGASNLGKLQEILRSTVLIRRLKQDVLTELPPKRRQIIEVPSNGNATKVATGKRKWEQLQNQLSKLKSRVLRAQESKDDEEYRIATKALKRGIWGAFEEIAKLRHETALMKVDVSVEFIREAIEEHKVVVFAHHKDVIDAVSKEFGRECVVLTGECNAKSRQDAVDKFQSDPNVKLFIGNIQAAGTGITLTAASHVIFLEFPLVPGEVMQAEDRCHRIGQHGSVLVQHLVLEGSIDAEIARLIVKKQEIISAALDKVSSEESEEAWVSMLQLLGI